MNPNDKLTRIGIFYDGGYLQAVSDYYCYYHERKARLSLQGIQRFAVRQVAEREQVDPSYCQIVDAHYFRGRFPLGEVIDRGKLEGERAFDDVLMRANVVTHYMPRDRHGGEKGVDVWLALEAFELAIYKRFSVLVLVVCDGDYLPLVRKVSTLGTRVMVLAWDFQYTDDAGKVRETRTAQSLLDGVTYPVMMHQMIDDRSRRNDAEINGIFLPRRYERATPPLEDLQQREVWQLTGRLRTVNRERGFGIIEDTSGGSNVDGTTTTYLFVKSSVAGGGFEQLQDGATVHFKIAPNPQKPGQVMAVEVTAVNT